MLEVDNVNKFFAKVTHLCVNMAQHALLYKQNIDIIHTLS